MDSSCIPLSQGKSYYGTHHLHALIASIMWQIGPKNVVLQAS